MLRLGLFPNEAHAETRIRPATGCGVSLVRLLTQGGWVCVSERAGFSRAIWLLTDPEAKTNCDRNAVAESPTCRNLI